jgi:hypothetical protein
MFACFYCSVQTCDGNEITVFPCLLCKCTTQCCKEEVSCGDEGREYAVTPVVVHWAQK